MCIVFKLAIFYSYSKNALGSKRCKDEACLVDLENFLHPFLLLKYCNSDCRGQEPRKDTKQKTTEIILGQWEANVVDHSLFNIFSYLNGLAAVCLDFFKEVYSIGKGRLV